MNPKEGKQKIYWVDVDFTYGPIKRYHVKAHNRAEARKKAKERYMKEWLRYSMFELYVYPD